MATSVPNVNAAQIGVRTGIKIALDRLFVPIDFSLLSERALDYTRRIARRHSAEIVLAHVSRPVSLMAVPEAAWCHLQAAQNKEFQRLNQIGDQLRSEGFEARTIALNGLLQDEIPCCCKEAKSDLIVLGADIKSGLERLFFGSDSEVLFRNSSCPVLVVGPKARPAPDRPWHPRDILCASDFRPQSAPAAAFAWRLAQQYEAAFTAVHVERPGSSSTTKSSPKSANGDQLRFLQALTRILPEAESTPDALQTLPSERGPCAAIVALAKQRQSDFIVMGAHATSHASTRLLRGTVAQMIAEAPCPVLVLHTPHTS